MLISFGPFYADSVQQIQHSDSDLQFANADSEHAQGGESPLEANKEPSAISGSELEQQQQQQKQQHKTLKAENQENSDSVWKKHENQLVDNVEEVEKLLFSSENSQGPLLKIN